MLIGVNMNGTSSVVAVSVGTGRIASDTRCSCTDAIACYGMC